MGGMIAQVIAQQGPQLVRKMIIAGTGPAGGEGIDKVTRISYVPSVVPGIPFRLGGRSASS